MVEWSDVFAAEHLGGTAEFLAEYHAVERPDHPEGPVLELRVCLPPHIDLDTFDYDRLIPVHAALCARVREAAAGWRLWLRFFSVEEWRAYVDSGQSDWPEV
ncbi:MAG: hypothetical protein HZB16_24810 [Armatimonadetes bacterium]|nr:hypothetical protein [Armatimonadota bacterium]